MDEQTTVVVVEAEPSHHPLIGELTLRAYEPVEPNMYKGGYAEELADVAGRAEHTTVLVALYGGFVIGAVTYIDDESSEHHEFDEPGVSFRHLAVDPSAQGLGAGRALVDACLERAAAAGAPRILLHSLERMTTAQALYERLGFERDPTLDRLWGPTQGLGYRLELGPR